MAYKVYLCDILGAVPDNQMRLGINTIFQGYFDRVAARTSFRSAFVHWLAYRPQVANNELLIYFMPEGWSIISVMLGKKLAGTLAYGGHWGYTNFTTGSSVKAASEVYVRIKDAKAIAHLAFHEAMHNKLLQSSRQLHNGDGLRDTPYRSSSDVGGEVNAATQLTPQNITDMANALANPVPQWTEGIDTLLNARARKHAGDPLWDT